MNALAMFTPNQVVLTVVLPLLAAFLLPVVSRVSEGLMRWIGPAVLVLGLLTVYSAWASLGAPYMIAIGGFAPPLGIAFYVDPMALLFTLLVLVMTLLLWPYGTQTTAREQSLTLILAAAACGLALSGDLFNIYVFYELASVASFGLVAAAASGAAYAAAIRYVIISGFGTVLALTGIALVYTQTGTLNLAQLAELAPAQLNNPIGLSAFVLMLLGVGVKGELFPVNTWVPEVYATAKTRVTALLAGVVSKLAVLVIVRMLVLVFQQEQALHIMLLLGLAGVISGELAAWRARDMNRMLAYSSIGQLGMIFVAFSIPGEAGVYAGLALALHHLLVKPALFLLAGWYASIGWKRPLDRLHELSKASPLGVLLFVLFALSLIGVPPLPGFWAKLLLVTGLVTQSSPLYLFALGAILLATVVEANYFFRTIVTMLSRSDERTERPAPSPARLDLATAGLLGAVLLAAMLAIAPLGAYVKATGAQAADSTTYIQTVFPRTAFLTGNVR